MINSYPSIYALGHKAVAEILKGTFVIEEKIDGSQFSMCLGTDGILRCRSKGQELHVEAPEKMFSLAVETAKSLPLHPGWVYRCEYLKSPKHNTLAYSRVPAKHLIVFDICTGPEFYLDPAAKRAEAERLGLESVACFFHGNLKQLIELLGDSPGMLQKFLDNDSVLGGAKIEGVVLKNYSIFTADKKIAIAKFVSPEFKEKHQHQWKKTNPTQADIVQFLITQLKTEARWNKAIQHLRDAGALQEDPRDIGPLIKEIQSDTQREEADEVKEVLFKHFWPQIQRGIVSGFPEFYKQKVSVNAFEVAA